MLNYINFPSLPNKTLKSIEWKAKQGDFVSENTLICYLILEFEEASLLSQILNTKVIKSEKLKIFSSYSGILHKKSTTEEIEATNIICIIRTIEDNIEDQILECDHEIEYGGICVKCGQEQIEK